MPYAQRQLVYGSIRLVTEMTNYEFSLRHMNMRQDRINLVDTLSTRVARFERLQQLDRLLAKGYLNQMSD
jgi:predicted DNA-binding protein YlxM (UPF0122 family)